VRQRRRLSKRLKFCSARSRAKSVHWREILCVTSTIIAPDRTIASMFFDDY
jgi:hypothetical protein